MLSFPSGYKLTGLSDSILATFDFLSAKGKYQRPGCLEKNKVILFIFGRQFSISMTVPGLLSKSVSYATQR